jgi:hypothetical protein
MSHRSAVRWHYARTACPLGAMCRWIQGQPRSGRSWLGAYRSSRREPDGVGLGVGVPEGEGVGEVLWVGVGELGACVDGGASVDRAGGLLDEGGVGARRAVECDVGCAREVVLAARVFTAGTAVDPPVGVRWRCVGWRASRPLRGPLVITLPGGLFVVWASGPVSRRPAPATISTSAAPIISRPAYPFLARCGIRLAVSPMASAGACTGAITAAAGSRP